MAGMSMAGMEAAGMEAAGMEAAGMEAGMLTASMEAGMSMAGMEAGMEAVYFMLLHSIKTSNIVCKSLIAKINCRCLYLACVQTM